MKPNSLGLLLFCGALIAAGPLTTDMYVPAIPSIREYFGVAVSTVQLTLTFFVGGYALGQLSVGPLADRFGRRPLLLIGLGIYLVATAACAFSPTIEVLVVGRFLQAIGASAAWIINRTIIRDMHDAAGTTRMIARTTMIMGATSTCIPLIGGWLIDIFDWRAILFVILVYAAFLLVLVFLVYRETVPQKNPHAVDVLPLLRTMRMLLGDRIFAGYTATVCFMLAAMFVFVSNSSFVFMNVFGLSPRTFGLVFTAIASSFLIGNVIADQLSRRLPLPLLCAGALAAACLGAVLLTLGALVLPTIATILVPITLVTLGLGVLMPICFAGALGPHAKVAGTASSLIGFIQAVGSVVSGQLVSLLFDDSAGPLAFLMTALIAAAAISFALILGPVVLADLRRR